MLQTMISPPGQGGKVLRSALELARDLPLSIAAKKLLLPHLLPPQLLKALVDEALYVDAIRFMAIALLPREAVWWACLCCRHTLEAVAPAPPVQLLALRAAVNWVVQPLEVNLKAVTLTGAAAGPKTAAGCAALAASHGGMVSDVDQPVIPTQPKALSNLAGAAVLLAAVAGPAANLDLNYRQFLALGIDVDLHHCHWGIKPGSKSAPKFV